MNQLNETNKSKTNELIFFIRVKYRRNSSWQGTIQWMDGKTKSTFRSVLELGNLINDARQKAAGESVRRIKSGWENQESAS